MHVNENENVIQLGHALSRVTQYIARAKRLGRNDRVVQKLHYVQYKIDVSTHNCNFAYRQFIVHFHLRTANARYVQMFYPGNVSLPEHIAVILFRKFV